jgi:hypothetical protein
MKDDLILIRGFFLIKISLIGRKVAKILEGLLNFSIHILHLDKD